MSKIYVIHENNEWTVHLEHRLKELGLPYEMWHLDQGLVDLSSEPPQGVFYNRISASSHTRGHRFAPEFADSVIAWLERHNRIVINGSNAVRLELSKVNQYMALNLAEVTTPKTIAACGKKHIVEAAIQLNSFPFITKHNRAGKGQGVYLFDSVEELKTYVESDGFDEPVDGITLVQQYINSPEQFIIRHEFIGGKFLYGVKVDTSKGFELCPADVCSIEDMVCPVGETTSEQPDTSPAAKFEILDNYRPVFVPALERFLADNKIDVAGIEVITDADGNHYTYDVNTNTNYNSDAEELAQTFGMLELAKYLGQRLSVG